MRLYVIKPTKDVDQTEKRIKPKFAGSMNDASKAKRAMLEENPELKQTQVHKEDIEVPTGKGPLIEFLNKGEYF